MTGWAILLVLVFFAIRFYLRRVGPPPRSHPTDPGGF